MVEPPRIIWAHHKGCSYGYLLSDAKIDKKGRYVFEDSFVSLTNENRIDGYIKTVISPKTVITTVTNAMGDVVKRNIEKVLKITFEY